jgi:hypothetical protein
MMFVVQGTYPIIGDESIMKEKAHGTSATPVQKDLRWNCDVNTADRICNFNRHFAEYAGCVVSLRMLFVSIPEAKDFVWQVLGNYFFSEGGRSD